MHQRDPSRPSGAVHPRLWRSCCARGFSILLPAIHLVIVLGSLAGPVWILADALRSEAWRQAMLDLPRWLILVKTTLIVSGIAIAINLPVAIGLAIVIFRTHARFRLPSLACILLAAGIPIHVTTASVFSIFGIEAWRESEFMVGLIHAIAYVPISVLIIGISLRSVSRDMEENALVCGGGMCSVLARITLPSVRGGILASALLILVWTSTDYSVSDVLMVRTFAEEVYTQFQLHQHEPQVAVIGSIPLLAVFTLLFALAGRQWLGHEEELSAARAPLLFNLSRWTTPVSLSTIFVTALVLLYPVLTLSSRVSHLRYLTEAVKAPEIRLTAIVGLVAGVACGILGLGIAWLFVRRRTARVWIAAYLIFMLAMPAAILGLGMIRLFNHRGIPGQIYDSPVILVLAYTFRFLPVAVLLLIPIVRKVPVELEQAARSDGCGSSGIYVRILWPLCLAGVLGTTLAVTILSLGELPCSLLVTPPGYLTVPARFFSLIHYGLYPDAAALCLVSIGMALLPWLGLLLLLRKRLLA